MLRAHASQVELMRLMYDVDLIEMSETLARLRGVQRGCGYAEAFQGCGTFPEPDGGIRRLLQALARPLDPLTALEEREDGDHGRDLQPRADHERQP
jgi:hypothetical protein